MGMIQEFKEFALKGNVVDMAVGIVIGGAFATIVTSLVDNIVMPLVSLVSGGTDFTNLFFPLDGGEYGSLKEATDANAAVLGYGAFIQSCLNFFLIALAIFLAVKVMNRVREQFEKKKEDEPEDPTDEVKLLTEIRDSLAK